MLGALGLAPRECPYRMIASGACWRLRAYGGKGGPAVLVVAAPIKRPYIWDLAPPASAVRFCLGRGWRVYLLEWIEGGGNAGLGAYVGHAMAGACAAVTRAAGGAKPFLIGHSLGGTFAALFAALEPESVRGLVLLSAPLCFQPGSSEFRDRLVELAPKSLADTEVVPGSLLSEVSVLAAPGIFLWERMWDGAVSLADPHMAEIHARIERWTFDEFPLPARLVQDVLQWLYRENRFCRGTLELGGRAVRPAALTTPTLAVVNRADGLATEASVRPFIEAMAGTDKHVLFHDGEAGVGLQHVAILAGPRTLAQVWPRIAEWIEARAERRPAVA